MPDDRARINSLLEYITKLTMQRDSLVMAQVRATGNSERVVRLEFGIDQQPEVWAEDSERGAR